jgi:hypothetical protein
VYDLILNILTVAYIAIMALVAGCVSMCEDKALGVAAWHLTFPISAQKQWLVKLLVTVGVAVLLGLVLPTALAAVALITSKVGLIGAILDSQSQGSLWFLLLAAFLVLLGFWCASFCETTVRAILMSMVTVAVFGTISIFADWCSDQLSASHQLWAVTSISPLFAILIVELVALWQSFAQFQRAFSTKGLVFKRSLVLATCFFFVSLSLLYVEKRNQRMIPEPLPIPAKHEYRERVSTATTHMCSMILSPNCEHLISVAPSIKRAKS